MHLALMQAKKALGNTKGNPSVGCIIVKNNSVIGADCTGINGRPHAEEKVISKLNKNNKNLNLYVTLEPCSHKRKSGPCVKLFKVALFSAGRMQIFSLLPAHSNQ